MEICKPTIVFVILFIILSVSAYLLISSNSPISYDSIHSSVEAGTLSSVKAYIRGNPNSINERDKWGRTPLLVAVTYDKPDVAEFLIESGVNISLQDNQGDTALHVALSRENIRGCVDKEVNILLEAGLSPNIQNMDGVTAFHMVCSGENVDIVKKFIKYGANATLNTPQVGSPLNRCSYLDIAKILIAHKASVTAANILGQTPLHMQINPEIIALLVKNGALVDAQDMLGKSPLHYFAKVYVPNPTAQLLKLGANPNIQDSSGKTPLHVAAEVGNNEDVALLIQSGANLSIKDKDGCTPLDYAKKSGGTATCKILEDAMSSAKNDIRVQYRPTKIATRQASIRAVEPDARCNADCPLHLLTWLIYNTVIPNLSAMSERGERIPRTSETRCESVAPR